MKSYKQNLISGTVLFVFAAIYFKMAFGIKVFRGLGSTPLTAQFMPKFWGVALLVLSALVVLRGIRQYAELKKSSIKEERISLSEWWRNRYAVVLTFVSLAVYIVLLEPVGFVIATLLYVFFNILMLTPPYMSKNYAVAGIVAAVTAVLLDYVFVVLLNVLLPKGLIGF